MTEKNMGRCSYILEKPCQKETWEGSEEFCIFHDPSPDKDADLFTQELEEQMQFEKDKHRFIGYIFPKNWKFFRNHMFEISVDFRVATFPEYTDFSMATFQGYTNFGGVTFQDVLFIGTTFYNVNFWGANFQERASFIGTTFQTSVDFVDANFYDVEFIRAHFKHGANFWRADFQYVDFSEATLQGTILFTGATFKNANFTGAIFQDADFREATFHGEVELTPKSIKKMDLRYTKFLFQSFITADLTTTLFHRCFTENVAFIDCIWPRKTVLYEEKHRKDEGIGLSFNELETIYRNLKQNLQNHGDYLRAGDLYFREMEMRRKGTKDKKSRLWHELYRVLAGYGEKPERTALSAIAAILLFALTYWFLGCLKYPEDIHTVSGKIASSLYFSFVTFTTLGLGDIHPVSNLGRTLVCCEAVIGAFLIALFVVVFARKMMR